MWESAFHLSSVFCQNSKGGKSEYSPFNWATPLAFIENVSSNPQMANRWEEVSQ